MQQLNEAQIEAHKQRMKEWWDGLPESLKMDIYNHYTKLQESHKLINK